MSTILAIGNGRRLEAWHKQKNIPKLVFLEKSTKKRVSKV
jgi:hypothetical protein